MQAKYKIIEPAPATEIFRAIANDVQEHFQVSICPIPQYDWYGWPTAPQAAGDRNPQRVLPRTVDE